MLLTNNGITQVTVTGDTRFDRVFQNHQNIKAIPEIEKFISNKKTLVAGSTWQEDEKLLATYINQCSENVKYIIVPHEINFAAIEHFINTCNKKCIRYSTINKADLESADVLLVDTVGLLSHLYQYANVAYIGGGFGKGIHNILEATVFGVPVVFGSAYKKFDEAVALVQQQGAFSISDFVSMKNIFDELLHSEIKRNEIKKINAKFIFDRTGATKSVMKVIKTNF
jgi:3-deoxy-D-manno-octulosonic-acid transferase